MKRRVNLSEEIAESIKNDIVSGTWKPGDKLPGEYEMAAQYEVSRFTVREAIKLVSSTGLVSIEHGVGTFVNTMTPDSYMKPLLSLIALSDVDLLTICEARQPIEVQSIALCAKRATPEDVEALRQIYGEMGDCMERGDYEAYHLKDMEFHKAIVHGSQNMILCEIINTLQDFLRVQMAEVFDAPGSKTKSQERHYAMIVAIEEHNAELATLLMSQHIQDSIDYVTSKMEDNDSLKS